MTSACKNCGEGFSYRRLRRQRPRLYCDETEGLEPAPYGFQIPDDPDRYRISELGHSGRHMYGPINGMVH